MGDEGLTTPFLDSCSYLSLPIYAGRYFDEISQDTGKYCFGVEDTLKALEMGAVEILIVYENLDTMRYILRLHGAEQQNNGSENGRFFFFSFEHALQPKHGSSVLLSNPWCDYCLFRREDLVFNAGTGKRQVPLHRQGGERTLLSY